MFVSVPSLLIALLTVHALGQSPFVLVVAILLGDWAFSYETLQSKIRETDGSGFVLASVFFRSFEVECVSISYISHGSSGFKSSIYHRITRSCYDVSAF